MSDGRSYRQIVHPGNPQTPDDSPWAAFKDGYIENVPIDISVHSGWVKRAIRSIEIFKHVKPIAERCIASRVWAYRWLMWAWRTAYMRRYVMRRRGK